MLHFAFVVVNADVSQEQDSLINIGVGYINCVLEGRNRMGFTLVERLDELCGPTPMQEVTSFFW